MRIPINKEHGSWAVFIFSCAAGLITGLLRSQWQTGKDFSFDLLLTVMGLVLLINAKTPFLSVVRAKGQRKEELLWFGFFSLGGIVLLTLFLTDGIGTFLFFSPLVLCYVILLLLEKEHYILTELIGFALLTMSALIFYFVITGEISFRLYAAVFIFFAAGVFKVKLRIKKTLVYRRVMIIYCAASLVFFYYLNISFAVLMPLFENIISVFWMRDEKFKTTGNIELIKGIVFTMLLGFFWQ